MKPDSPLISIIVPVYNVEKYIHKCVDSILNQTYRNIEVILVDDGSPDRCPEICDEYARIDSRVKVIHKENGGLSSAREIGVKNITGEYAMIVDSDDWIDLDTVSSCIQEIENDNKLDCILFSYTKERVNSSKPMHIFDNNIKFSGQAAYENVYRRLFGLSNAELKNPERMENIVSCCMKLYRKDVITKGMFIDNRIIGSCEDGILNIYALYGCSHFLYLDKPLYHYRKHEGTLTSTFRPRLVYQWSRLFKLMERIIEEKELDDSCRVALNNRIALSITAIGLNELSNTQHSAWQHIIEIHRYISWSKYQKACWSMKIKELPLPWKILMICCRLKLSTFVFLIILAIQFLKKR